MGQFFYISSFVFFVLTVATAILFYQKRKKIGNETANNLLRLRSWWIIALIVVSSLAFEFYGALALSSMIVLLSTYELVKMTKSQDQSSIVLFSSISLLSVATITLFSWGIYLILGIFLLGLLCYFYKEKLLAPIKALILVLATSLFMIPALYQLRPNLDLSALFLCLILVTSLNDVFQYIAGKCFGKHALAPKVSPNKTVEGALGGVLLCSILSMVLWSQLMNISYLIAFILGACISIAGILGDLNISQLKRNINARIVAVCFQGMEGY